MKKKKIMISILGIVLLLFLVVGLSYAIFTFVGISTKENVITSGNVTIIYTEENELKIENAMPISDDAGKALTGNNNVFDFTVQANIVGDINIGYEVTAIKKETNTLKDTEIKLYLEKNDNEILSPTHYIPLEEETNIGSPIGSMIIDEGVFTETTINHYIMKMWVDENTEITENVKFYTITVNVYAKDIMIDPNEKYYTLDKETGTITGYSLDGPRDVVIPSMIDGVKVTAIGTNVFRQRTLTSVVIPEGITNIGPYVFYGNRLTSITIPESVTSIGESAFRNNNLTSVEIPNNVTSIGIQAFAVNKITEVVIPNSLKSIDYQVFYGNELTSVTIPESVTSIGDNAFHNNQLTSVVIPESVTSIGRYAFQNNKLTSVEIPSSVTSIAESAFQSNPLTKIINKTGKEFNWNFILNGRKGTPFVTGTIGSVVITAG